MRNQSNRKKKISTESTQQLIEADKDIQSFIYQQITEFEGFVTPQTLILVMARNPNEISEHDETDSETDFPKHRIAIVLKEDDATIESEFRHDDIYDAISGAKKILLEKLIEIQEEVENPKDRLMAIQQASTNEQIH